MAAIYIIEKNLDKADWGYLSENPAAIYLLENNLDEIFWKDLSKNPAAIHLIEQNLNKIDWAILSENPSAIHILKNNLNKVNWAALSKNPAIFVLDINAMRQQINNGFVEELIASALHPRHFERNVKLYNYDICLNEYIE